MDVTLLNELDQRLFDNPRRFPFFFFSFFFFSKGGGKHEQRGVN